MFEDGAGRRAVSQASKIPAPKLPRGLGEGEQAERVALGVVGDEAIEKPALEVTFATKVIHKFSTPPTSYHLDRISSLIYLHIVRFMCVATEPSS